MHVYIWNITIFNNNRKKNLYITDLINNEHHITMCKSGLVKYIAKMNSGNVTLYIKLNK